MSYAGRLSSRVVRKAFVLTVVLATVLLWPGDPLPALEEIAASFAFSENSGASTADWSGHANHGALTNGAAWTSEGRYGAAVEVDGVDDAVVVPDSTTLDVAALTLEAWIFPTAATASGAVIHKDGAYSLGLTSDSKAYVALTTSSGTHVFAGDEPVFPNQWTHIEATYANGSVRLFVNAVKDWSWSLSGGVSASAPSLQIGGTSTYGFFQGRIDEVRIYSIALSEYYLRNDMNAPIDPSTPLTVGVHTPASARGVLSTPITARFTRSVNTSTLTASSFQLRRAGDPVAATISYDGVTRTATLTPTAPLEFLNDYSVTVLSGPTGVKDTSGGQLAATVVWSFQTGSDANTVRLAYGFGEGAGMAVGDASGNGNIGTVYGGAAWTAQGRYGRALVFDGVDDAVRVPDADTQDATAAVTMEAWVRPTTATSLAKIVHKEGFGGIYPYWLGVWGGHSYARIRTAAGQYPVEGPAIALNDWTHLAATYDGATLRLFVNGGQVASTSASGALVTSVKPLWIGSGFTIDRFQGRIDDVRLYVRALTAAEILADMNTSIEDITGPAVVSTSPIPDATGVDGDGNVTATFDEPLASASVSSSTFELQDTGGATIPATISYDATTRTATLDPTGTLSSGAVYTAILKGGTTAPHITDVVGNPLATGYSWSFTTAAASGGPTLVSVDVFPRAMSLSVGGSQQFSATAHYSDGTTADVSNTATWASSPTAIATATATGRATGVAAGDSVLTATYQGRSDDALVTVYAGEPIPPDPRDVAPPLDRTAATPLARTAMFLFTGENPIQRELAAGAMEARRVSVIRGRVINTGGQPISGARVTIVGHPELGHTLTRLDGAYDMAVNGGGVLTVEFTKPGLLPVRRQTQTAWQDYAHIPDAVMIVLDPQVTTLDLSAATSNQVAQGSVVTDADGSRQSTLLFTPGTTATLVMPDGTQQAVTTISVRATEYSVGANGERTMPAPLPPTSGYTYAVEYSVDQAVAAGAREVRFNQPVVTYTTNFLDFPTGDIVPAGYFDRGLNAWVASDNGRVIRVVSETGGRSDLDVDGSGGASSQAALDALGITDAERQSLAALYDSGASLWRVPVTHFSAYDYNWPITGPNDAQSPNFGSRGGDENDPTCASGSIIECQNQTLGETLPIVGAPFSLHYRSSRAPGRKSAFTIEGPLTEANIPASLKRVELVIYVSGHQVRQTFPAQPNLRYTYTWDGTDGFGRRVQGSVRSTVVIYYVYDAFYGRPRSERQSFALTGTQGIVADLARSEILLSQTIQSTLGLWDMVAGPAGGWSLGVHHFYDFADTSLYLGSGERRSTAQEIYSLTVKTAAGTVAGVPGAPTENVPATNVPISPAEDLVAAPDGSLYFSESPTANGTRPIRRVRADGVIQTVGEVAGVAGAVGPDGSLYFYDESGHVVRRRAPDGTVSIVAGIPGQAGYTGDGGPATQATLNGPCALAAAPDGALYVGEFRNDVIRRIDAGGNISTLAGTGTGGDSGDGGPATSAQFSLPCGLATGPDGSVYVADLDATRVRRITPDGIIRNFAGNGSFGTTGDGGIATAASVDAPWKISVAPSGVVYISEVDGRIRRVDTQGIITTIAGTDGPAVAGDSGPAVATPLSTYGVAVAPDGAVYAPTSTQAPGGVGTIGEVRRFGPALPGFTSVPFAVASEDGAEVYVFDDVGRHLRTLNALTGGIIYSFEYDGSGRLTLIRDGDANVTTLERTGGAVTRIIAPGALATDVAIAGNGLLSRITDPAGQSWKMTYSADALLLTFEDPNGGKAVLAYDADGRLETDRNAANGTTTIQINSPNDGLTVTTLTSSLGRQNSYAVEKTVTGEERRDTDPAGLVTRTQRLNDLSNVVTTPDGVQVRVDRDADPRWYMDVPILKEARVTTPGGLVSTTTATRQVQLADRNDPLSLQSQLDRVTVNGRTYEREYDRATNTVFTSTPEGRLATTKLDTQGRVVEWAPASLTPVQFGYSATGLLTTITQGARQSTIGYDGRRRPATLTDAVGRQVSFTYDPAGRVLTQTLPDTRVIEFSYDANGNVTSLTPPGRPAHTFAYTPIDFASTYTPPVVPGAGATGYIYNLDKQLTSIQRPDGQTTTFSYNGGAQLAGVTFSRGQLGYTYDTAGRLQTLADPGGVGLTFTYDGPLPLTEQWTGSVVGTVTRTFTPNFQVSTEQVGSSPAVSFVYDDDGLLTDAGALNVSRDNATGLVTGTWLDQTTEAFEHNTSGELSRQTANVSGTPVFDVQYTRDALGRITQRIEVIDGVTRVWAYEYDLAGRLTLVRRNGVVIAVYAYDANGNRTQADTETGIFAATYDDQDRLLSYGAATYTYTANGELASKTEGGQTTTYQYDTFGNLMRVNLPDGRVIEYRVDGRGRRVAKLVDGVVVRRWLYGNQLRPVAEVDAGGTVISRFVYGTRPNVPEYIISNGMTYRVVADHLGSPRIIVNAATGEVVQRQDFDVFGRVVQDSNPGWQPFGFAAGISDSDTGLTRFGARDYDSFYGRWTAKDPIGFAAGDTVLYGYADGDPVNLIDADGRNPWLLIPAVLLVLNNATRVNVTEGPHTDTIVPNDVILNPPRGVGGAVVCAIRKPIADKVSGYTKHGLNRAIGSDRPGANPKAILDAVRNPKTVKERSGGVTEYAGKDATVRLNQSGKVVTTFPTSSSGKR